MRLTWRAIVVSTCLLSVLGCSENRERVSQYVRPDSYIYLDGRSSWGHVFELRLVDWGGQTVHVSGMDEEGYRFAGAMPPRQYHRFWRELNELGAFDLRSFTWEVCDADEYILDINDGARHNRIHIVSPWEDEFKSPGVCVPGPASSSKSHAEVLRRLFAMATSEYVKRDGQSLTFYPDRILVDTSGRAVSEAYFDSEGRLNYGVVEYPSWYGGELDGDDAYVTWHTVGSSAAKRMKWDSYADEGQDNRPPRPDQPRTYDHATMPWMETIADDQLPVQPRLFGNGRVVLFVDCDAAGCRLMALDTQNTENRICVLALPDVSSSAAQFDIAPDGSVAAWIAEGQLYVYETPLVVVDEILADFELQERYREERRKHRDATAKQ